MKDLILGAGAAAFLFFITSPTFNIFRDAVHAFGDAL
tara:strand:- start:97 stop:207 length:111 start_codon:yes stop_codon:yes gene_type:complete